MHMVTETRQLRDGEKLTEFYNRIGCLSSSNAITVSALSSLLCHASNPMVASR